MPDHIHIFIGMKPSCSLSDLVREIKKSTNEFINDKKFTSIKFQWQEGFGAFSYSHSALDNVIAYFQNQKEHHKKRRCIQPRMGYMFLDKQSDKKHSIPKGSYVYKKTIRRDAFDPFGVVPSSIISISINIKFLGNK